MNYRPFKKRMEKVNITKLEDLDFYFEEIPPSVVYKIRKSLGRNMRKLKAA
jgi:hypothetical protein